jgi:hypothetical protein
VRYMVVKAVTRDRKPMHPQRETRFLCNRLNSGPALLAAAGLPATGVRPHRIAARSVGTRSSGSRVMASSKTEGDFLRMWAAENPSFGLEYHHD